MQNITMFTFFLNVYVCMLLRLEIITKIKRQSVTHIPIVICHQENAVYQFINSKLKKNQSWKSAQSFKYDFINKQTNSQPGIVIMINTSHNWSLFWKKRQKKKTTPTLEAKFEARPILEARPKFGLRPGQLWGQVRLVIYFYRHNDKRPIIR